MGRPTNKKSNKTSKPKKDVEQRSQAASINALADDVEVGAPWDEYERPEKGSFPPVPRGGYPMIRDISAPTQWQPMGGKGKGSFYTKVVFVIQEGESAGRKVFEILSTMVSQFRRASSVQDYLTSMGFEGEPANGRFFTLGEIREAVETVVEPFRGFVDNEIYCPACKETLLKGDKKFPRDAEGKIQYSLKCPECGELCNANPKVRRYIMPDED